MFEYMTVKEAAQNAVMNGKQTALLSMATGTRKTRTVLGMVQNSAEIIPGLYNKDLRNLDSWLKKNGF